MGVLKKCGNFLTTSNTALINECLAVCASTVTNLRISFFSPKEILIFLWSVVFCVNLNIRFPSHKDICQSKQHEPT